MPVIFKMNQDAKTFKKTYFSVYIFCVSKNEFLKLPVNKTQNFSILPLFLTPWKLLISLLFLNTLNLWSLPCFRAPKIVHS